MCSICKIHCANFLVAFGKILKVPIGLSTWFKKQLCIKKQQTESNDIWCVNYKAIESDILIFYLIEKLQ